MTLQGWVRDLKKKKVLQHCVNSLHRYVMNYRKKKNETQMRRKEHDEEQEIKVCEKRHKKMY